MVFVSWSLSIVLRRMTRKIQLAPCEMNAAVRRMMFICMSVAMDFSMPRWMNSVSRMMMPISSFRMCFDACLLIFGMVFHLYGID